MLSIIPNLSDEIFFGIAVPAVIALVVIIIVVSVMSRKKKNNQLKNVEKVEEAVQAPVAAEPVKEPEPAPVPMPEPQPVPMPIPQPEPEIAEVKVEEIKEEIVAETVTEEPDEKDEPQESEAADEEVTVKKVVADGEYQKLIIIKYSKSFTAKLIQSSDEVKNYYSQIKNELLSYKGVKSRTSWKYESFNAGRVKLAKMSIRGKNLSLYLALDPKKYADSKYIVDDMSAVSAYVQTPLLYRIKNDRRLKYSKDLIANVMEGRERHENAEAVDYVKQYPYEKIEPLIARGLVKQLTDQDAQSGNVFKLRESVQATEVNELIKDEIAVALIENSEEVSDRTKIEIVNVDVLSKYFEDGETVTIAEIKKRVPNFTKSATAIKVLARGVLDKKLTVIADNFSLEAAKMIILTGGSVVKKKSR